MPTDLLQHALAAKGFMPEDEGEFLHSLGRERLPHGPALEIGTYCGKSAIYLGAAAQAVGGGQVLTLDHHRGSEENQAGWEHHDASTVDAEFGLMDTLPIFRKTIARAGLENEVTAIIGTSTNVATWWSSPLSLLFIDGGHAEEPAQNDYSGFARWIMPGGTLVIHDVFERPEDGGQAPFHVWQRAVASGSFEPAGTVGSMRALTRTAGNPGDPVG